MKLAPLALVVACGACGAPPPTAQVPVVHEAAVVTPPTQVVAPRVVTDGPPRRAIEAPGSGMIETFAIAPDGKAAITCDELGGVRLWPTLDGTVEPRVVDLADPKELAIGATAAGFTVVALDEVGGLVIANLDVDGRTRSHVTLAGDPPFFGLAMTELGALAWRTDQTIALLGADGTTQQRLGTEPGQRLVTIGATGRQAVAIVEALDHGKVMRRLRRVVLEPQLAWGPLIDTGGDIPVGAGIAVSSTGKRVAITQQPANAEANVRVFEIASGKPLASEGVATPNAIGFVDDNHLAVLVPTGLSWLDVDKRTLAPPVETPSSAGSPGVAVGGGHVVVAAAGELLVATPTDRQFLGYGLESPSVAAAGPDRELVVGLGETFVSLDETLHAKAGFDLGVGGGLNLAELHWLGGKDWLVEGSSTADGSVSVAVAATDGRKKQSVRVGMDVVQMIMFDATTQLVTLSLGGTPEIDRYDPKQRTISHVATLAKSRGRASSYEQTELVPVSPALAGGTQLIRVSMRDKMTVQWLRDPTALGTVASTATIEGSLAGADAAGHVFAWRNGSAGFELVVYRDGNQVGVLPHDGPVAIWPDPAGTQVVELGQRSVALYKLDGSRVWTQPLVGATEALWLGDGALAIMSAAGIARLDAATGAVTAMRCGWNFGLSPKPHLLAPRIEPLCVQFGR